MSMRYAVAVAFALGMSVAQAQVVSPGNNKPLPDSAQKAPPFQGGGGEFNALLKGEYIYAGGGSCVASNSGFNTETFQALGPTFITWFSVNGIRVFNGDGTGTMKLRSLTLNNGGASTVDGVGEFAYEVGPDLSITIHSFTSVSTQVHGPVPGTQTLLHGPIVLKGWITEDLSTMHVMQAEPFIERITTLDGNTVLSRRICYRERTLTRLHR